MAISRGQLGKMVEIGGAIANNTNKKKKYDPLSLISSLQKNVKPSYVQGGNKARSGVNYGKKMFTQDNRNGKRNV